MSVDIIVIRGAGDHEGEDIVEAILSTIPVAKARGRNEMDAQATAKSERRLEVKYRAGLEPGQLAEVIDSAQGRRYRGKLTDVSHRVQADPPQAISNLTIETPVDFYS